jgi:hypothetical protein
MHFDAPEGSTTNKQGLLNFSITSHDPVAKARYMVMVKIAE